MVTTVQDQGNLPASELEDEQIEPALARNFMSAVHLTREVLPHMKRYGMGRIINLVPFSAMEVSPHNTLSSPQPGPRACLLRRAWPPNWLRTTSRSTT